MDDSSWQDQQMPPLDTTTTTADDWEEWLRWDPAAEVVSPDDTFHSGSSKNDSPMPDPDPAFPVLFAKSDDDLIPPLIVGDDDLDFGMRDALDHDCALFGAGDLTTGFDFHHPSTLEGLPPIPRLDTNTGAWALPTDPEEPNLSLSAISDHSASQPSAGSVAATSSSVQPSPNDSTSPAQDHNASSVTATSPGIPKKRGGRKRKAETQLQPSPNGDTNGDSNGEDDPNKKSASHNVIEKRYRNNLNDKILELRNSVPALRAMGRGKSGDHNEDLQGLTPAHKGNKATIMAKATEYIKHLEKRNKTMQDEMNALREQLAKVEAAVSMPDDRPTTSNGVRHRAPSSAASASPSSQTTPPNFLVVPQDQTRFGQTAANSQYMQQQGQPSYAPAASAPTEAQNHPQYLNGRGKGFMNKMMLGAMAGVMVLEGFTEQQGNGQDPSSRQLAAIPTQLFTRAVGGSPPTALSQGALLSMLKMVLVITAVVYLLAPLLFWSPRRKQKISAPVHLPKAPSLASPVEVRRQAWLTAIQSVWVPKHFLLEVVAVGAKMFQLSLRRFVGVEVFMAITGTNKEEEAARIKAWDIAIDAQLAGGDAQVSYYKLLLTLMESGTLPDSPARLMQKAVHFRVFFWEVANAGYGNIFGFKSFTEKVGKIYWDSARRLQKELIQAKNQGRPARDDDVEVLPDYLARLVELECDEVLSDEMIQRAWNLAWNKPSAYGLRANTAKDSVVEDHAIRSPMDAVAAWYTNTTIDDTLADALSDNASSFDIEYYLGQALSVAPTASSTHVRALAAKAVLSNSNREANIVVALDALPVMSPTGGMNLVNHAPASPDVFTALTLAKLISLSSPSSPRSARERAFTSLNALKLAPSHFTLLTAVAAYRLLKSLTLSHAVSGVEELAGSLRVWAGTASGRSSGLGPEGRTKLVQLCLHVAKQLGGWEEDDSGYGSVDRSSSASPVRASVVT